MTLLQVISIEATMRENSKSKLQNNADDTSLGNAVTAYMPAAFSPAIPRSVVLQQKHRNNALSQGIDNLCAKLENLAKHVAHAAREAAPIGKDHQRQLLAVHVANGLRSLERRVGVPHLSDKAKQIPMEPRKKSDASQT